MIVIISSVFFLTVGLVFGKEINYSFTIQRALSNPDGYPRSIIVVTDSSVPLGTSHDKRLFPGPMIRGRKGDTIVLRVLNNLQTEATSIHFHGLFMKHNVWMDASGGITQPHIPPMSIFTYRFKLTQTGTYWCHSHTGNQYLEGLMGPIVIDYPVEEIDPVKMVFQYSVEYTIMLQDWFHETSNDLFVNYRGPYNSFSYANGQRFTPNFPSHAQSVLINGRGQFDCKIDNTCVDFFVDSCTDISMCLFGRDPFFGPCEANAHPPDEFSCAGDFIRLRLIHSGMQVPIEFWIDQHLLTVVARDGFETAPVT